MGAWIEIELVEMGKNDIEVAPGMGAWIEIFPHFGQVQLWPCRSRYGSVD